jgi:hypothetical protein
MLLHCDKLLDCNKSNSRIRADLHPERSARTAAASTQGQRLAPQTAAREGPMSTSRALSMSASSLTRFDRQDLLSLRRRRFSMG